MKKFIKIFLIFIFVVAATFFSKSISPAFALHTQRFWPVEAVDTVKYSRDLSRNPDVYTYIPTLTQQASALHATHIALGTPYDEEFYPVLKTWVNEARKYHLKVWFRGNFSAWEGWFGYTPFTDFSKHHALTKAFIEKHPDLFEDGDIFTPVPEPENGGPGDPRGSDQKTADYNSFLVASYNNCVDAFSQIKVRVLCGYFSMNGDIAKDILTPETVQAIGNTVAIDHYVDSSQAMEQELTTLENKFPDAQIILGEFGAPIPDINGNMTQSQQADFVTSLFNVFYQHRKRIGGVDYWTLAGGSTALLDENLARRQVFNTVAGNYAPPQLDGRVTDTLGNPFANVQITDKNGEVLSVANGKGYYSLPAPLGEKITLVVSVPSYRPVQIQVNVQKRDINIQDIKLSPDFPSLLYRIRLFLKLNS